MVRVICLSPAAFGILLSLLAKSSSRRRGGAGSKVSSSSGAPTFTKSKSSKFNSLAARLGRVEYDYLEEGGVLGEGTFGTVVSGTYRGRDVAVKKARGAVGSTSIMESFR